MFTIKKTILSIAAVASSVILLSSCGSSELVQPKDLAAEIGEAQISGQFIINNDITNDIVTITGIETVTLTGNGNTTTGFGTRERTVVSYDNIFPEGLSFIVTYNQSDVNPVSGGSASSKLAKSVVVTVGKDGKYSFKIPASGKGTTISVQSVKFETNGTMEITATNVFNGNDKLKFTKKYEFTISNINGEESFKVYPGIITLPNTKLENDELHDLS